jgi:single-strand DNA-binding protein
MGALKHDADGPHREQEEQDMSASLNRVLIMGNLTQDPSARRLSAGTTVADLSLAISETYRNKEGENVETTCFVDVVTWNKQADVCEAYLQKGSAVLVEGRLQLDEWTDKEGKKRRKLRVRADRVHFMDRAKKAKPAKDAEPEPVTT